MARSTKAEKARQLNAAHGLLQRQVALPEAVQRLSRKFNLSERQAYRYLEEAAELDRPVEVTEASVPITLKVPPSTAECCGNMREQWSHHRSDRDRCVEHVSKLAKKTWLSRGSKAAHGKFTFNMHLIVCTSRSLLRPTIFWCPAGSTPSVDV